jgi:hypothetical protein
MFSNDGNTLLVTKPDSRGFWTRVWHVPSLREIDRMKQEKREINTIR